MARTEAGGRGPARNKERNAKWLGKAQVKQYGPVAQAEGAVGGW